MSRFKQYMEALSDFRPETLKSYSISISDTARPILTPEGKKKALEVKNIISKYDIKDLKQVSEEFVVQVYVFSFKTAHSILRRILYELYKLTKNDSFFISFHINSKSEHSFSLYYINKKGILLNTTNEYVTDEIEKEVNNNV